MLLIGKDNGRRASLAGSTGIADLNTASVRELLCKIDPHALDPQAIVLLSSYSVESNLCYNASM